MLALAGLVGAGLLVPGAHVASAREAPLSQNDAGSGQDAGDTPASALVIAGAQRRWSANLTPPGSDTDWYRLPQGGAFCAVGDALPAAAGVLVMTNDAARSTALYSFADAHRATQLVLAAPSGAPHLGLEPASLFSAVEGGRATPSPGHYSFTLTSSSYADLDPEGDGDSPDAGATAGTAAPLGSGCRAGRLSGSDAHDAYAVDVTSSRALSLSFAIARGHAATAQVRSPTGALVATLESGDATDVWLDEPGRWTVTVVREGAAPAPAGLALGLPRALAADVLEETDYLLGLAPPPDPAPCRPSCMR